MSQDERTSSEKSAARTPPSSHVQQVDTLYGPQGRLEAILNTGSPEAPFTAVVCHPYPPAGGTMHTKVVYHAMKVLTSLGIPVLRFNFRGVGLSTGVFDHGRGEQDDVRAALDWLHRTYQRPLLFAGFSFGSYVGLRACCSDTRVIARIGLGLPVRAAGRDYIYEFLDACPDPMLFISGSDDEFCPPEILKQIVGTTENRQITLIPGADHFFQSKQPALPAKLDDMRAAMRSWLERKILPSSSSISTLPNTIR